MSKGETLEAKIEAQLREWAAELESLKAKADKAVAEARRGYYEHIDELREEIETKLKAWSKILEASKAKTESAEATAKTLLERLHGAIQTQLRELRPLIGDLRERGEAEKEAKRLTKEWQAKREPARAALGESKTVRKRPGRAQGRIGQRDHQIPGAFLDQTDRGNGARRSKACFPPPPRPRRQPSGRIPRVAGL